MLSVAAVSRPEFTMQEQWPKSNLGFLFLTKFLFCMQFISYRQNPASF